MLVHTILSPTRAMRLVTMPAGSRTRSETMFVSSRYRKPVTSDLDLFDRKLVDRRPFFIEPSEALQHSEQRSRTLRNNDQRVPFLPDQGFLPGELEVAGDPNGLVPTVAKQPDRALRHHETT